MNATRFIPLFVALVLGLGGIFFGRNLLQRYHAARSPQVGMTRVVIARSELAPGRQVKASELGAISIPSDAVPQGAILATEKADGRVALAPISKGQILIESVLADSSSGLGIQALVPPGMRAVCIDVSETGGLIGQLIPGAHVDVLVTLVDDKQKQSVTRTILENVKVVAVGVDTSPQDPQAKSTPGVLKGAQPPKPKSVTLMVTPRQAEAVELATSKGRPRLVLRGGQDNSTVRSAGVTITELVRGDPAALYERGGKALAGIFSALQARRDAEPTTRPVLAAVIAEDSRPLRRSIQVIKGGKESMTQLDVSPTTAALPVAATARD